MTRRRNTTPPTRSTHRTLALGIDAAWGGIGWSMADEVGPLVAGWFDLSSRTWRYDALRTDVLPVWESALADFRFGCPARPRVAVERPPQVHPRGNQAATAYAMGTIVGAIQLWATDPRLDLEYPWEIPTSHEVSPKDRRKILRIGWRPWFGLDKVRAVPKGPNQDEERRKLRKQYAIQRVAADWPFVFEDRPIGELVADWNGRTGDVAEAVLIAHGCAAHADQAPPGPRRKVDRNG